MDGDGVPEIVATNFFTSPPSIRLFGAPFGGDWTTVGAIRNTFLARDVGRPFDVEFVDVNGDGILDILATNHQGDLCRTTPDDPPGQVLVLEGPAGDPFLNEWTLRIILDDIRPQPTFPPIPGFGRLAPGRAGPFYPVLSSGKPWIAVGGDEAAKVWVLKPSSEDPASWDYDAAVLFDINDTFGPGTTQEITASDETISTIGRIAVRYVNGFAELFVPVFEARKIFIFRFLSSEDDGGDVCPDDILLPCPPLA